MKKRLNSQRGMIDIVLILVVFVSALALGGYVYYQQRQANKTYSSAGSGTTVTKHTAAKKTAAAADPYAGWKVFKSPGEGFTLRYPADWKITDTSDGNCGDPIVNGTACRDRFEFTSPDNIDLTYVVLAMETDDKIECGKQSVCWTDKVRSIQSLSFPTLGNVLLVELDSTDTASADTPEVALFKPLSAATTPKVGDNSYPNYGIEYSLPSKTAGRFVLSLHPGKDKIITADAFYKLDSVKQGELILKSLTY